LANSIFRILSRPIHSCLAVGGSTTTKFVIQQVLGNALVLGFARVGVGSEEPLTQARLQGRQRRFLLGFLGVDAVLRGCRLWRRGETLESIKLVMTDEHRRRLYGGRVHQAITLPF
jgi:hypothetical protein